MSEKGSKIFLLIRVILLIIPTTLFFLFYGLFILGGSMPSWESADKLLLFGVWCFCFLSIMAAWRVATCFYFKGRLGLDKLSYVWKVIGYAGGIYVVSSWLLLFVKDFLSIGVLNMDGSLEMIFFFGLFGLFGLFGSLLLVPLIHLSIEWGARSRNGLMHK